MTDRLAQTWDAVARAKATPPAELPDWVERAGELGSWALAADAQRFLISLVRELRPRNVLELGSGVSTRTLAWLAARSEGACRVTTLESDPEQVAITARDLERHGLSQFVSLQLAPLVARELGGETLPAFHYDGSTLASEAPLDLVLVDSPPAPLGGRRGTLHQFLERTRPGSVFVLDDADREDEQAAIAAWVDALGDVIDVRADSSFVKGLALVGVREPLGAEGAWKKRVTLAQRDLAATVGEGASFLLVDGWALGDEAVPAGRRAVRFPEETEGWNGDPGSQRRAVECLRELGREGHDVLALAWTCSWWASSYPELMAEIDASFDTVLENGRLRIFALGTEPALR